MLLRRCLAYPSPLASRAPPCTAAPATLARLGMRFAFGHCRLRMQQPPSPPPSDRYLQEPIQEHPTLTALKAHFQLAQSDTIPLFKSLDTYRASLPVRQYKGKFLRLHELEHWAHDEDLRAMADRLEAAPDGATRTVVKYLAAPMGSGKTCSVLPAFLKSAAKKDGFTHYLYIAFDNNNRRNFTLQGDPSTIKAVAEDQGAAFIYKVIKILVDDPDNRGPYRIDLSQTKLKVREDTLQDLSEYIQAKFGSESKLLIHADEHHKMCDREGPGGQHFSRGALATLAQVTQVTVVATYTQQPSLPSEKSSAVCRFPVALPCDAIDQIMRAIPELRFDTHRAALDVYGRSNRELRRLWATLRFRLAMKLRYLGLGGLHRRKADTRTEKFLAAFLEASKAPNAADALKQCIRLCKLSLGEQTPPDPNVMRLLIGMDETMLPESIERQAFDLVVVGDIYTAGLMYLLKHDAVDNPVYRVGRDRLRDVLTGNEDDDLAATPLEALYIWALSCIASANGKLTFAKITHPIVCKRVLPGRVFSGTDANNFDLSKLQPNTMYYALEKTAEEPSHPLFDIFFLTSDGDYVFIDVTGGVQANAKAQNLANWIAKAQKIVTAGKLTSKATPLTNGIDPAQKKVEERTLYGVVLAPLATGQITKVAPVVSGEETPEPRSKGTTGASGATKIDQVSIVSGDAALDLLGGLRQVFRWL